MANNIMTNKRNTAQKERYIGSVRFFKNMILLCIIVFITVPTAAAFHYKAKFSGAESELAERNKETVETKLADGKALSEKVSRVVSLIMEQEPDKAEAPIYTSLYPDFYAPQEYGAIHKKENMIYLTFDDGPTARTEEILDILAQKQVKATFFVVHHDDEGTAERMKRIVDEGHTIGMHSYSHDYGIIYDSVESFIHDMYKIFTEIQQNTGYTPTLFRFPGGSINAYNASLYQEMISEMIRRGFVPFDWNLSAQDAITPLPETQELVGNALKGINNVSRGVLLMHDSLDKYTTVEALSVIIDKLKERGFELDRLTPEDLPVIYRYQN